MRLYQSPSLRSWPRWNSAFFTPRLLLAALSAIAPLQSREISAQQLTEQIIDKKGESGDVATTRQCVWVAAWAYNSETDGRTLADLKFLQSKFDYTGQKQVPACFGQYWSKYCNGIDGKGVRRERNGSVERYGACWMPEYWHKGGTNLATSIAEFLAVPKGALQQTGYVFMDSACRFREKTADTRLCGFAGVATSPLSLILDESSSLESDMTVVDFALDLNKPGSFSLWKGSDKAPLLVYDPERSGNVATAARLFGNYTFGGRISDISHVRLTSEIDRPVWSNGYEALGLLDNDHDGKVAGSELDPISLWFDKNRNAQSEAGEVKSLKSAGITALYYQRPAGQAGTDDIGLDVGYERVIDGRTEHGRSIDWYGETFSSKGEALQALAAIASSNADRARLSPERDWKSDPLAFTPRAAKDHTTNLSGYWRWHMVGDTQAANPGAFAFDQSDDLSVRGFSIIETVLQKNEQDLHSGITILPAEGKLETDGQGNRVLKLTVTNPDNTSTAETKATLEENGFVLKGTTTQRFVSSNEPNAKSASLTYEWVAQKFVDQGATR